jgi:hypothetical protein
METSHGYYVNNIFITTSHPFTWKSEVKERIDTLSNVAQFIVSAPHGTGMTDFAETVSYDFANSANDVLLVTDSKSDADRVAFDIQILKKCNMSFEDDMYVLTTKNGTITIPTTQEAFNDILINDNDINVIVADGCEKYSNEKLHCLTMKSTLNGAVSLYIGAEEEFGKTYLNKSIWQWFLNHPSYDVNRVIATDSVKNNGVSKEFYDALRNLLTPNRFCVA